MTNSKALELLMQVEPGMVLVNKEDFSLLIVRALGGGRYLCISEDNKIVIIDLLKELKSSESLRLQLAKYIQIHIDNFDLIPRESR